MTAERHAGAPPRWHDRFSPTWWAAWLLIVPYALHYGLAEGGQTLDILRVNKSTCACGSGHEISRMGG